jgi:hypothetical protein
VNPHIAGFLTYAQSRFPDIGTIDSPDFFSLLGDYCHQNIQFALALKNSELDAGLFDGFHGVKLESGDLGRFAGQMPLSVLNQEYNWPVGRYPNNLFIQNYDHIGQFVDYVVMPQDASRISRLQDSRFFCVGSCFASNVSKALQKLGADVHTTILSENINSPKNNVDLFRYLDTGEVGGLLLSEESEVEKIQDLAGLRDKFTACNTLILTLGCAYSLISLDTGHSLRKPAGRCGFDAPTVGKIADYLHQIVVICLKNHYRRIFLTVSPVPLAATLIHNKNPFITDSASKAMLRASVEEVCGDYPEVEYVPAFEVFRQAALHASFPTFGLTDGCSRHVDEVIVGLVLEKFLKTYFRNE